LFILSSVTAEDILELLRKIEASCWNVRDCSYGGTVSSNENWSFM